MDQANMGSQSQLQNETELRIDLAAAFRLAASFGWNESVSNHFSCAVGADGGKFLLNPKWKHFARIRASDLLLLDVSDPETMRRANAPDATAWSIHGAVHRKNVDARVVLHAHPPYSTALSSLRDPGLKPIDQTTARFYGLVNVDLGFGGLADGDGEAERLAAALGEAPILMMGNHGVTVSAKTIPEAFEHLYLFERAAKNMILAYSSGQPLSIMSHDLALKTAAEWLAYTNQAYAHFEQLKDMLDEDDPSFKD
ncbi:class II aldolase/adducin family protein [Rhizobium sp. NXC24]|uniref:class II aldolase/adducin family protein n=1 Tax=Rhizobium sp. NXC24 TaxID=2048897 RepID=UPI000CDF4A75|nr:class II aldolase/adducin family protein [Rhizobium sp. NXC24]AVA21314.1 class II aldolase/adducin domain-containing protein [Rhizobium sp. NXC24]